MSAPTQPVGIEAEIRQDFAVARADWLHAREHAAAKDSVPNREAVMHAEDELNAVLDLWLEARGDCE